MNPDSGRLRRLFIVRMAWCLGGAAFALAAALAITGGPQSALMLASFGGSSVFLFGLSRTPAAQPRALLGGHLGGAAIGICCYQAFGDALWVYALAIALTLCFMLLAGTVHPPAGANPVIMIHGHAAFGALLQPVLAGVLTLAAIAYVWSRLAPGHKGYPASWNTRSPRFPFDGWQ